MAAFDNLSNPSEYLAYWGKTYRNELLSNILPFWMKYGLDKENGGYFTAVLFVQSVFHPKRKNIVLPQ